jgi:predicted O-methyltransferase YrrM
MIDLSDGSIDKMYKEATAYFDDGATFVEIGCYQGGSTVRLVQAILEAKKNIKVYCVDIWDNFIAPGVTGSIFNTFWQNIVTYCGEYIVRPIQFDSSTAAMLFEDESIDFCFIDGDHSRKGFTKDLVAWLPKIKKGGWIGGHDYNQEVEKVCHEILEDQRGLKVEKYTGDGPISVNCNSWLVRL